MKIAQWFCGFLILGALCTAAVASGARPTPDEMEQARRFADQRFGEGLAVEPVFSFIYNGGASAELIGTWRKTRGVKALDGARTQYMLTWSEPGGGLQVRCTAIRYADYPAVEWVVDFTNTGSSNTPIIEKIAALGTELREAGRGEVVLHHSLGDTPEPKDWAKSFMPLEDTLSPDGLKAFTLAPVNGWSSCGQMPFFNLHWQTGGVAAAIGWSGQWEADFRFTESGGLRVWAGQQLTCLRLHPGESIRTPRMLFVFWAGNEPLRGNNLFRQVMMAHYLPRRNGELVMAPIIVEHNYVDPDGSKEGPILRMIKPLASLGIEVFKTDSWPDNWYPGKTFPAGVGTWEPDPVQYPRGLAPISEALHAAGMQYLLWMEPERAMPGTKVDQLHPEWLMKGAGWGQLFKLGDSEARKWLTDYIDVTISGAKLDWLWHDFAVRAVHFWRQADAADRQGISENHHIEGLYAMWDELMARHPGLVIDICCSGGRRIDLETLSRGLPLWHNDLQLSGSHPAADQLQNGGLWRWVPMHGCGSWGNEPSYAFRSAMTSGNCIFLGTTPSLHKHKYWGKEPPLEPMTNTIGTGPAPGSPREYGLAPSVAIYKKIRPYLVGDFYPLFPHSNSIRVWYGYQFDRPDRKSGMAVLFRREQCDQTTTIRLNGIAPHLTYRVTFEDTPETKTVKGADLAALEVKVPGKPGSTILYYEAQMR